MNRRGFLKFLSVGTAVAVAAPHLVATLQEGAIVAPVLAPAAPGLSMAWLAREIATEMASGLGVLAWRRDVSRICDALPEQFGVELPGWDDALALPVPEFRQRYLTPMASALAHELRRTGATTTGELPVYDDYAFIEEAATHEVNGICVRALRSAHPWRPYDVVRTDVLFGES